MSKCRFVFLLQYIKLRRAHLLMVLQLDLFQEGGLPRDVKVMGPGLHTGFHHSLPVESNKKDRIGNGTHS
jgi:hypothetical protein